MTMYKLKCTDGAVVGVDADVLSCMGSIWDCVESLGSDPRNDSAAAAVASAAEEAIPVMMTEKTLTWIVNCLRCRLNKMPLSSFPGGDVQADIVRACNLYGIKSLYDDVIADIIRPCIKATLGEELTPEIAREILGRICSDKNVFLAQAKAQGTDDANLSAILEKL